MAPGPGVRDSLAQVDDPVALLVSLFTSAPVAFAIYTANGDCLLVNDAFVSLYGAAPPPGYNLFADSVLAQQGGLDDARRALEGETVPIAPLWYQHVDPGTGAVGPRVAVAGTVFPIRGGDGAVRHIAFAIRDVTAETRLQTSLAELERFRDSGIIGVLYWTYDGRIERANDVVLQMLGYTREELDAGLMRLSHIIPIDLRVGAEDVINRVKSGGQTAPRETEVVRKDGSRVPIFAASAALKNDGEGAISFMIDLSDRKRAERTIVERERRYSSLVENIHDLLEISSTDGTLDYVSESWTRILGLTPEETVGTNVLDYVHPEDRDAERRSLTECAKVPGRTVSVSFRRRAKDGSYRHFEGTRVNRLADPALRGIIGSFSDVTERKSIELQFLQAQKMEAVGRLAGGVAHDFNNMLSAIIGFAGMVVAELSPSDPHYADIKEIITAGDRATMLTRQLLAFSRKQILEPRLVDLTAHVAGMDRMLRRLLGEDVELAFSLAPELASVRADPAQLEQVVMNLVINARDAITHAEGRIVIETTNVVLDEEFARRDVGVVPGPHVLLSISDNGEGMSDEVRQRVFEPFFTTKAEGRGTGLGLATVFGIVRQSGGHIWVDSTVGGGSTFTIYFPASSGAPELQARVTRPPPRTGSETVLLVEDEHGVRAFMKRALERDGYTVLEAQNGDEALRLAESHGAGIDLLLTDVVMPRMSGKVLADRLTAERPDLQVIFMSGYTEDAVVTQGVLEGAVHFLAKPITFEKLRRKVRAVLDSEPPSSNLPG